MSSSVRPFAWMRRLALAATLVAAGFGATQSLRAQSFRLDTADVVRFLHQATWGPTPELIDHVRDVGIGGFLDEQFEAPMTGYPPMELYPTTRDQATCPNGSACQRDNYTMHPLQTRFFRNALYGEDQLRQRVAFALHQIIVVSGLDITLPGWMTPYLQTLYRNAFGDYRVILECGAVVEGQDDGFVGKCRRHARTVRIAVRQCAGPGFDQQRVGVAVVAARKLDDLVSSGVAAS